MRPIPALTICQPYAHLIVTPQAELPTPPEGFPNQQKRVENRRWSTDYRGPLAIHAGKSRKWLELAEDGDGNELEVDIYGLRPGELVYGAVIGIAELIDCVPIDRRYVRDGWPDWLQRKYPWLPKHEHAEGPYGWILENARRLVTPIPARGQQGMWQWVPPEGLEFA